MKGDDLDKIKADTEALTKPLYELSAELYKETQAQEVLLAHKALQVLRVLKKPMTMLLTLKLLTTTRNNPVYKAPSALLKRLDVLKVRRRRFA